MKFSYNWLQSFFKKRLPSPQKLAELLTLHSFEVKEVKKQGKDYLLDIDVLPNRVPDCGGHLGIAREIRAITNYELRIGDFKSKESKIINAKNFIQVEIKDKDACPRYTAKVIFDVKVRPSPQWLKERLEICGIQSINNIVDIANYVMLETGQPLHAFDFNKLESVNPKSQIRNPKQLPNPNPQISNRLKKIIIRFARKGEKITTLDEKTYDLDKDILVIADIKNPVAIAGIKGGKAPEITEETKIVVLESANFKGAVIRKASRKLNLKTDASLRFEHNLDPNLTEFAIERAAYLMQELAKGKVAKGIVDFYPQKALPRKIKLDLGYLEKLLGLKIPKREIKAILKKLEFKFYENRSRRIRVEVPTWRQDISIAEDLIEEIGRVYGYEKIPAVFPLAAFVPPKGNEKIFWRNFARNILKEIGFTEVYNYSFISEKQAKIFSRGDSLIALENPISSEQKYLRPSLIPNLLKNVKDNSRFPEIGEIKIFELGKVFSQQKGEKEMLAGLIFQRRGDEKGFYRLKGVLDTLLKQMGISNIWYDDFEPTPEESPISVWHKRKCAEIKADGQEIGFLGEISNRVLTPYDIKGKIFLFDLDFEELFQLASEEHEYQPLSSYPAAVRDIAILVPQGTKVVEVLNIINSAGGKIVRDVDLFDVYTGQELPEGKKNFAFHIIYQAEDRTLSSEEIDKIHNKIIQALEKNLEWEVRK
jgi:phenylalanyl-tRNA synthetase beta chain